MTENILWFLIFGGLFDAVVLTHAHIDYTGYLPKLCTTGFSGKVYCAGGTRDLLQILLPDSGYLQEEDARRANKYGYSRHRPAQPLYTKADAERCLKQLTPAVSALVSRRGGAPTGHSEAQP